MEGKEGSRRGETPPTHEQLAPCWQKWHHTILYGNATHLAPLALLPEVSRANVAVASSAWDIGRAPRTGMLFVVLRVFARPPSFRDGRKRWWCRARGEVVWRQPRIRVRFGARNNGNRM